MQARGVGFTRTATEKKRKENISLKGNRIITLHTLGLSRRHVQNITKKCFEISSN